MENKKIAAIALIMAISLSAVGLIYAHWSDTATINGEIHMGTLTLAFDYVEGPKASEMWFNETSGQLVDGEFEGKDVGSPRAYYLPADLITDSHTGKQGYTKFYIEANNTYPQYRVHTTFVLHNIGTMPLDVLNYTVAGEKRYSNGTFLHNLLMKYNGFDPVFHYWWASLWEDLNDNGIIDAGDKEVINVYFSNHIPYQIDPCNTNKAEVDLDFKQDAEMCHLYTLHFQVIAVQWNAD
jgi:hypothetical protein